MTTSINADLADRAAEHALDLLRFDAGARAEILGFLRRLEVRLDAMVRSMRLGDGPISERRLRLEFLLAQARAAIGEEYSAMAATHEDVGASLARWETATAVPPIRSVAIAAEIELNVLTAQQLRSIASNVLIDGAPSRTWWERQAGDLLQRFTEEMRVGVAAGESVDDLVRRVRGRATGRRHVYEINGRQQTYVEFAGGLMDTSTRHAEALVRTSVAAVSADARRATFEANQDVVKGVVQISTFDLRTTTTCLAYGGKSWSYPDMEPIDHDLPYLGGTPRHWGCRSTEAPLLRSWRELGIDLDDAGAGRRWSRLDGKVPGDWTADDFLRRRSDAQVDALLGPGVGALWRAGKISVEDAVSRASGLPLRVADVEAIAGRAA